MDRFDDRDFDRYYRNRERERERNRDRDFEQDRNFGRGFDETGRGYSTYQYPGNRYRSTDFNERYQPGGGYGERNWDVGEFGAREYQSFNPEDFDRRYHGTYGGYGASGLGGRFGTGQGHYTDPGYQPWSSRERGRFHGIGPKNYRRSDERIREDINERLTFHDEIDASDIDVIVRDCEVTLKGNVPDRHAKRLAEDLAESVLGVREVQNQLRIGQQETFAQGQSQQGQFGQEKNTRVTDQEFVGSTKK